MDSLCCTKVLGAISKLEVMQLRHVGLFGMLEEAGGLGAFLG
jgi:hypothetical protein